jgi:hypothetical protein
LNTDANLFATGFLEYFCNTQATAEVTIASNIMRILLAQVAQLE